MTLGLGYPVTLQTNLADSPSLTSSGSGFVTKHGLNRSDSGSIRSGALCQPDSISRILSMLAMPFGS